MGTEIPATPRPEILDFVYEIQREFSRQSEPAGLIGVFIEELSRLLPISRLLYVMPWPPPVRRFANAPGADVSPGALGFRVLLDLDLPASDLDHGLLRGVFAPRDHDRADAKGGLLGEVTAQSSPLIRHHLSLKHDEPWLGPSAPQLCSMMAVPIFWQGAVQGWIIAFARDAAVFTRDELRLLLTTGNALVRSSVYLDGLEETRRASVRVRETLAQIGAAQRSMLPDAVVPDPRLRIAIMYETCEESGGDHYDVFEPQPGTIEVMIADVSGHGAVATVGVAMLRTAVLAQRAAGLAGTRAAEAINALMCKALRPGAFITALFMSFKPETGQLEFVNRGHPPPLLRRADGCIRSLDVGGGLPLGIMEGAPTPPTETSLEPGDLLILFSDGIPEAFSPSGELFGMPSLMQAVETGQGDPERTKEAILRSVALHEAGRPRRDDQTLVLVSYTGPERH